MSEIFSNLEKDKDTQLQEAFRNPKIYPEKYFSCNITYKEQRKHNENCKRIMTTYL
jgi:regulator of replication initiation timing